MPRQVLLYGLLLLFGLYAPREIRAADSFDLVNGFIESPRFMGKDPLTKLQLASDMVKHKQVRQSEIALLLLDWADQYLHRPADPLERLKLWPEFSTDERLSLLRIPRDYLNRTVLTEYLVSRPDYLHADPAKRLEIIGALAEQNLVDWSVALAYARLYAGAIIMGAKDYEIPTPFEALTALKRFTTEAFLGSHYRAPTEGLLAAEALAADSTYRSGDPRAQLEKLRDLEADGLITSITRKKFAKLPAWRLIASNTDFLKADLSAKRDILTAFEHGGLLSPGTAMELLAVFKTSAVVAPVESRSTPAPQQILPPVK